MAAPQPAHVRLFTADLPLRRDWPQWYFQDRHGKLQGPFPAVFMSKWCEDGALRPDLKCVGIHHQDSDFPPTNLAHLQPLQKLLDDAEAGIRYTPVRLYKDMFSIDIHSSNDLQLQPLEDLQERAEAVVQDAVSLYITILKKEAHSFDLGVKFQQKKDLGEFPQHIISAASGFTAKYDVPADFLQQKQQQIDAAVLQCRKTLQDISLELVAKQCELAKAEVAELPSRSKAILMAPFEVVPETHLDKPYMAKIIKQQQVLFDWKLHAAKKSLTSQQQAHASKQQQRQANVEAIVSDSGPVTMQQQVNEAVAAALKSQLPAALAAAGITSSSR